MIFTIETIIDFLDKDASILFLTPPFCNWHYVKSIEKKLEKPLIDYVFKNNGIDFLCDQDNSIRCIFIYFDNTRFFSGEISGILSSSTRQEVIKRLGYPTISGCKVSDPILGDFGDWDRFSRDDYAIHVEYKLNVDAINKITFMRADVVP